MPWLVVDVVLVVGALVLLAVVGLRVWRSVKALGRRVTEAGERLGAALDDLERAQAAADAAGPVPVRPATGSTRLAPPQDAG